MKNKKLTYILLPLVIIVWGAIVYRIIVYFTDDGSDESVIRIDNSTDTKPEQTDTFSLLLNYPDPFLKSEIATATTIETNTDYTNVKPVKTTTVNKKDKKESVQVTWPAIVYGGLIKNKESSKTCLIVKINGVEHIMSVGDVYSDVKLEKVYRDSIVVTYMENKKTIKK